MKNVTALHLYKMYNSLQNINKIGARQIRLQENHHNNRNPILDNWEIIMYEWTVFQCIMRNRVLFMG